MDGSKDKRCASCGYVESHDPNCPRPLDAKLEALWKAYESNDAGLDDLGHFVRLHHAAILKALSVTPSSDERIRTIDECVQAIKKMVAATPHWTGDEHDGALLAAAEIERLKNAAPQGTSAGAPESARAKAKSESEEAGSPAVAAPRPEGTPRVDAVAPVDAFVTDSDHWAVSKTDYDCLLDVARKLELDLGNARQALIEDAEEIASLRGQLRGASSAIGAIEPRPEDQPLIEWLYGFPNLQAIVAGTVSGSVTEWPTIRGELLLLIGALRAPLREATAIGIADLFAYCGAYETLSAHQKRQWDRLSQLAKLADDTAPSARGDT